MTGINLPCWAVESLKEYVRIGRPVGGFLEAVLSNDLMNAFGRADEGNCRLMFEYAKYVYNKMPMGCHGSRKIYNSWCESGGLEGQEKGKEASNG
jgi:hypothetical protein